MNRVFRIALSLVFVATLVGTATTFAQESEATGNPVVVIKTSKGEITVELNQAKAPISVENFLKYVDDKAYDGTVFHRVIKGFMIQGGGFDTDLKRRETREPIKNEADNGLKNEVGTIAMARTGIPDSATSQFFINTVNNSNLNHRSKDQRGWGYTVFGKVTSGLDVVKAIESSPTANRGGAFANAPTETVTIESVRLVTD